MKLQTVYKDLDESLLDHRLALLVTDHHENLFFKIRRL